MNTEKEKVDNFAVTGCTWGGWADCQQIFQSFPGKQSLFTWVTPAIPDWWQVLARLVNLPVIRHKPAARKLEHCYDRVQKQSGGWSGLSGDLRCTNRLMSSWWLQRSWCHIGAMPSLLTWNWLHDIRQTDRQTYTRTYMECLYPDSKVHGANMGPTWVLSAPDGPHVGPMNLAMRVELLNTAENYFHGYDHKVLPLWLNEIDDWLFMVKYWPSIIAIP